MLEHPGQAFQDEDVLPAGHDGRARARLAQQAVRPTSSIATLR